jgi:hypothetical protein
VLAPALLLLDNVLHPKEYAAGNEARQLQVIAGEYTRWQVAHMVGFVAILIYAAAVLGLAFVVRRRQPRLGLAGGALGMLGLLGFCGVIAIDGFTWGALGATSGLAGSDPETAQEALHTVQGSDWSLPFYLLAPAWIAGMAMLAIGVVRQGAVPAPAGAALLVASLVAGTEPFVISNAYFIAGAAALLVGGVAVAAAIASMSDATFAAGGPGGGWSGTDRRRLRP